MSVERAGSWSVGRVGGPVGQFVEQVVGRVVGRPVGHIRPGAALFVSVPCNFRFSPILPSPRGVTSRTCGKTTLAQLSGNLPHHYAFTPPASALYDTGRRALFGAICTPSWQGRHQDLVATPPPSSPPLNVSPGCLGMSGVRHSGHSCGGRLQGQETWAKSDAHPHFGRSRPYIARIWASNGATRTV